MVQNLTLNLVQNQLSKMTIFSNLLFDISLNHYKMVFPEEYTYKEPK